MTFSLFGRGSRRAQDPRIKAATELAHELVDPKSWFDPIAISARGWKVVPLVFGHSEDDQTVFLEAAQSCSPDFVEIDLDMDPLVSSIATWDFKVLADMQMTVSYQLRISCSHRFALLNNGFEYFFLAGPPEFLEQCLRHGTTKMWHNFLEYVARPAGGAKLRANFDRLAQMYGAPETIEEYTHIDLTHYTQSSMADRARVVAKTQEAIESPGGFKREFLNDRDWQAIPTFYHITSTDAEVLCEFCKMQEDKILNVVFLNRGDPVDVLSIPLDSGILWRLFLKGFRDQILVYPPSETWFFLRNNIPCHVLAAKHDIVQKFSYELETSWKDILDNKNNFKHSIDAQMRYNDIGRRYAVPGWCPFEEIAIEQPSPPKPRLSLFKKISNYITKTKN